MTTRVQGKVVHFRQDKNFGFIAVAGEQDLFFHRSAWACEYLPMVGEAVSFEIELNPRSGRRQAVDVMPIEVEEAAA